MIWCWASPPFSSLTRPQWRLRRAACRTSAGSRWPSARCEFAERLARLLALPEGRDARIAPMTRHVALALALTMFAMFAFRRWYAFAAAGIAIVLAIEVASIALARGVRFRWKDAVAAAALGLLTLLALISPVIVDWLPNLSAHDYASAYAAYRKPLALLLRELSDWVGLMPALAALAGAAFL